MVSRPAARVNEDHEDNEVNGELNREAQSR